jgi:serine phosphatase RsbU (regulator of sigma subunit)
MINLNSVKSKILLFLLVSTFILSAIIAYSSYIVASLVSNKIEKSFYEITFFAARLVINTMESNGIENKGKEFEKKFLDGMILYVNAVLNWVGVDENANIIHYALFNNDSNTIHYNGDNMFLEKKCKTNDGNDSDCIGKLINDWRVGDDTSSKKYYSLTKVINEEDGLSYEIGTIRLENTDYYLFLIWPKASSERRKILYVIALFFIIFFSYISVLYGLFSRTLRPLELLSQRIAYLSECNFFSDDDISKLKAGLPISINNEIGRLAQTFALMTDKLSDNIRQLVATTAAKERIDNELNIARDIQLGSLPKNFSFPPEKEIELYATMIPAREVGGDLYDFFFIDEKHLCIAVGDVSDKGVSAALTMFLAKKLISSIALQKEKLQSPVEIVHQINTVLSHDNLSFDFVTLFFGIFDVTTGVLRYVNCGHVSPLFTNRGNPSFFNKELSGPPLGVKPPPHRSFIYKEITRVLPPGEAIFLCTDGVTEAMNGKDEIFGEKRLLEAFDRIKDSSCEEIIAGIYEEVKKHAGTAPQSDDIAMLMVRWSDKK